VQVAGVSAGAENGVWAAIGVEILAVTWLTSEVASSQVNSGEVVEVFA